MVDTPDPVPDSVTPSGIIKSTFQIYGSIFLVLFAVFLYLRVQFPITFTYNSRVYEHITPLSERRYGPFKWIYKIFTFTDEQIFDHCGMSAIVYLRFLRLGLKISFVGILNSFYLIPSNMYGCHDKETSDSNNITSTVAALFGEDEEAVEGELGVEYSYITKRLLSEVNVTYCYDITDPVEKIALGHTSPGSANLWATTVAAYIIFGAAMYFIFEEFAWFTQFRHKFLTQVRPDNYTVFVSHIPPEFRADAKLKLYFQKIFGRDSVLDARLVRDISTLEGKVALREKILEKLEHAVNVRNVKGYEPTHNISVLPSLKKSLSKSQSHLGDHEEQDIDVQGEVNMSTKKDSNNNNKVLSIPEYSIQLNTINEDITRYIEAVDTKRHQEEEDYDDNNAGGGPVVGTFTSSLTMIQENGTKEEEDHHLETDPSLIHPKKDSTFGKALERMMKDSANMARNLLKKKDEEGNPRDAGFVTFTTLMATNQCVQTIHHAKPFTFTTQPAPRPNDIVWSNTGVSHKEQQWNYLLAQALTIATCLFWTIPVSFISSLSEVERLKDLIPGLEKALENNSWLAGFLAQLKPLLLVVLTAMLPMILTFYCKKEGHVGSDSLNASLLTKLSMFMIVQIFFVQVISGSIFAELAVISKEPTKIVNRLAESIPAQVKSFIQFVQVQNFLGCGLELLRLPRVVMAALRERIGPNLTDKERNTPFMGILPISMPTEMQYPSLFAELILYFMINLVYSCVAPIMSYILVIAFIVLNVVFRHQLIYTYSREKDDGGSLFTSAIQLLISCMMISEVTLMGIILLKRGFVAGGLLVPLLLGTIWFLSYLKQEHFKVTVYAPSTLCMEVDEERRNQNVDMNVLFKGQYIQSALWDKVKYVDNLDASVVEGYGSRR